MGNPIEDLAVTVTEKGRIAVTRMTAHDAATDVLTPGQAQYLRDELGEAVEEAREVNER